MEQVNWEKKEKLNIVNVLDEISNLSKKVISREIQDIYSKIETLQAMGIIKDENKMKELKMQIKKLNLEA
jgi:hypothetical protein